MKPKPGHIFCLLGVVMFLCYGVQAQEAYPMEEAGAERNGTYTLVDGETGSHLRVTPPPAEYADADTSGYAAPASTNRSESAQRTADKGSDGQSGNGEDSVLGFNFLYYIIQKFKMSDIVEK